MPELTRFYGIVVMMYAADHNPSHIHAKYAERRAQFEIETGKLFKGNFPNRATMMVQDWIAINRNELLLFWKSQEFKKLNPLD